MKDDLDFSDFTLGEKVRVVGLAARMVTPRANLTALRRKVERIEKDAQRRKQKK